MYSTCVGRKNLTTVNGTHVLRLKRVVQSVQSSENTGLRNAACWRIHDIHIYNYMFSLFPSRWSFCIAGTTGCVDAGFISLPALENFPANLVQFAHDPVLSGRKYQQV